MNHHLPTVEALVALVAGRVVLVRPVAPDVVLIVHLVGVLLGVLPGLDLVDLVHALGLRELVNFSTNETSDGLLGEGVAHRLAYSSLARTILNEAWLYRLTLLALVVLPGLHAGKRGSPGRELVGPLALVLLAAVHLTVSIFGIA